MKDPKNKKPSGQPDEDEKRGGESLGVTGMAGIVLLAAALFNVPAILKIPETTADKMMLVIILAMAAGGAILLHGSTRKK